MIQKSLFGDSLDSLLKRFEDIHNHLYANEGLSEQQVLDEIVKILFLKYYDELSGGKSFSIFKTEHQAISSGKEEASFRSRIARLFEITKQQYKEYFDNADSLKLSTQSLAFIVEKLQKVNFKDSAQDANGLAFQKFLGRHAKGGRGQFFTPDPIIDFCVEIIRPAPNERIIDPACGTGGFIFSSFRHIKRNYSNIDLNEYVRNCIFGIEINKRISQIAKIKFLIECNADPNIICSNSLDNFDKLGKEFRQKFLPEKIQGYFDIVLTNPPFGTQGKIANKRLLSQYDLGFKWNEYKGKFIKSQTILNGQVPEILFVERCLQLLVPGGRLGIVLPNGHFENSSLEYLRQYIKSKANILGVVLLPQETFIPYGTGVKASLLFLQKKNGKATTGNQVFFSKIHKTGYAGNKNGTPVYKKDIHGCEIVENGRKSVDEDFSLALQDYDEFRKEHRIVSKNSFSINIDQLNNRLDYNYYAPENRRLLENLIRTNSPRLSDIAKIVKTKSKRLREKGIVEYVELSDINTKSFEIINSSTMSTNELPSRASYELKTGDIITAVAGNSIGTAKHATAYVTDEYSGTICTNGFRILREFKINPFYLLYYFQSSFFLTQVFMYRTGAAIPALSDDDFSSIRIYLPSNSVIDEISSTVERCFQLRQRAKSEFENTKALIDINHITIDST